MKHIVNCIIVSCAVLTGLSAYSQSVDGDFVTLPIHQEVRDFKDTVDLSSPLKSYITFANIMMWGRRSLERSSSSYGIRPYFALAKLPDREVPQHTRDEMLRRKISELIIYKDSVAGVITDCKDSIQLIRYLTYEGGRWVNRGEGFGRDLAQARENFKKDAPLIMPKLRRVLEVAATDFDTIQFSRYLEQHGKKPVAFLLDAFASHKLTIYGEIHRRKVSWQLMKDAVNHPQFAEHIGTIFMELPSDAQQELDRFFSSKELEPTIILGILQEFELPGWCDRGMYEFLLELWMLNKTLPEGKKLRIIAADIPRPFSSLKSKAAYSEHFDGVKERNEQMADIIKEAVDSSTDARNTFFIVGAMHAYKSPVSVVGHGRAKDAGKISAGGQLLARFPANEVYTIFSHTAIITNAGLLFGRIRNGLFDHLFAQQGGSPIAFSLANSPFGREPFDGLHEVAFDPNAGSFEDNFDGYIFLEPLEEEDAEYILYDLFTDDFVDELKRRAEMLGEESSRWYGTYPKELTKEKIISYLKERSENLKRWQHLE